MNYVRLLVGVIWLVSVGASAGEVFSRGAYVGGVLGSSEFDDDGAFSDFGYYYDLDFDDTDTMFGAYGGYRFFKYFSVEGRLLNLGSYSLKSNYDSADIDATALTANAIGIIPFGESGWELFGQIGVGGIHFEIDDGFIDDSSDEVLGTAGIGIRYTPIHNLSVALELDAYAWESDSSYDPFISTMQVAIQYNFGRSSYTTSSPPKAESVRSVDSQYDSEVKSIGEGMMCNDSFEQVSNSGDKEVWNLECGDGESLQVHCVQGTCVVM